MSYLIWSGPHLVCRDITHVGSELLGNKQQAFVSDSFLKAYNLGEETDSILTEKKIKYISDTKAALMPIQSPSSKRHGQ